MEIFRHYYSDTEYHTSNFLKQHMNNFGFCNLDGSKINGTINTNNQHFRYKLDTKKQTYLSWWTQWNSHDNNLSQDLMPRLSNGYWYSGMKSSDYGSIPTGLGNVVCFLPLKNNGFLLNYRGCGVDYYSGSSAKYLNPSTSSNDVLQRDKNFLVDTPTPSLNIKIYGTNTTTRWKTSTNTFIGLPPCKGNLNWTYLYHSCGWQANEQGQGLHPVGTNPIMPDWEVRSTNSMWCFIDFGDGKVIDLTKDSNSFKSPFIRNINPTYNDPIYTNINANICSMIKFPYDNSYIDGIYLLTTAPQQLEDGTFFSFDGRNFLNAFDNFVVELPPSTT